MGVWGHAPVGPAVNPGGGLGGWQNFLWKYAILSRFYKCHSDTWIYCPQVFNMNNNNTSLTALCPGLPRWAGTRKVKTIWILLSKRQWVTVASAPTYASLHLTLHRYPSQHRHHSKVFSMKWKKMWRQKSGRASNNEELSCLGLWQCLVHSCGMAYVAWFNSTSIYGCRLKTPRCLHLYSHYRITITTIHVFCVLISCRFWSVRPQNLI